MKKFILVFLIVILGASAIFISRNPRVRALFLSKKHFITSEFDDRVRYEPNAEGYAKDIVKSLTLAIDKVEREQFSPFKRSFKVFIVSF